VQPYFAYGSNLHPHRLADRLGAVSLIGVVRLANTRLLFDKVGRDHSGKCNLELNVTESEVWGALYELTEEQFATLDQHESRGHGYARESVSVSTNGDTVIADTYIAMPEFRDGNLQPFSWYRDLVLAGARHHQFPPDYCRHLEDTTVISDPDRERRAHWHAFAQALLDNPTRIT